MMQLKALKIYFKNGLKGYYPNEEIESFFLIASEFYLGYKRIDISLKADEVVNPKNYNHFQELIERLKNYEPIQYILGETEFFGLPFKVNESVLIPRPETEELVDWIINSVIPHSVEKQINILDIGTGSGCIAISLAKNIPNAKVYALDVSKDALSVAQQNAQQNNVDITFVNANVLELNSELNDLQFDVIVSNPPYVRELEKELMHDNVLKHEPHLALFVEDDNALVFYRVIAELSQKLLKENGLLFFEINEYLGVQMKQLLSENKFQDIELRQDINQKDRMTKAVKL
ncbi:peptide chain release factor N(5)-glutamine methyltransferase [Pontimicrobium sp. IMCC45349]|uniref:peptide chain release factor N(5)-glutamine methyltransferase n=1 Tax=Pontimicrobium sp. IMCC45349 TaxID=3391574 RepID=UPI0039A2C8BC